MQQNKSNDILAKLLATENITVTRENVQTASFDIKNRVLRLPRWKNLTQEIEEMLLLHEVGHALYTTEDGYGIVYKEKKHLKGYANVIEDVRIEKKMKDRYPGSRKAFNIGYTQLNERDFFKVKAKDLSKLLLIDRINIFYKVGYASGVQFTPEEYVYVQRTDQCKTEEDVIELAEDIFNFSKGEKHKEQQEEKRIRADQGGGDHAEVDPDDQSEVDEEELVPETVHAFDESLSRIQDHDSRTVYYEPDFESHSVNIMLSYKRILEEWSVYYDDVTRASIKASATEFKTASSNIVNYLVKEFEMRKSADAYKRIKISRLGQIDMRKLYAYQLKDDIFRQMATVQEGKKHGMIFLLDWSGSMNSYMQETVEQVINLAMFCRKINIPFQVLGFSDGYHEDYYSRIPATPGNENGLGSSQDLSLFELFSDKMNTRDFNSMIEYLLQRPWKHKKYHLNGTPLNGALVHCVKYIGEFIRKNDVEKMTLITLTDGESNELYPTRSINKGYSYIYEDGNAKRYNVTSILRDPVTKKDYDLSDNAAEQTATLMNLIRDRYAIHSVGFYISDVKEKSINRFVKHSLPFDATATTRYSVSYKLLSDLRKNKCAITKQIPGRDELYIIATSNKIEDEELDNVTQDMSASQIARQLGKVFNSRKSSRVVLNSFVGMVA